MLFKNLLLFLTHIFNCPYFLRVWLVLSARILYVINLVSNHAKKQMLNTACYKLNDLPYAFTQTTDQKQNSLTYVFLHSQIMKKGHAHHCLYHQIHNAKPPTAVSYVHLHRELVRF